MNGIGSPATNLEFKENERSLRQHRAIVALLLGVVLMPAGLLPDWMLYRESFASLFAVRMFSTVILAIGLAVIWKTELGRSFEPVSFFLIFSPAVAMAAMMFITDGGQSTYYFGLILLMIVVHLLGFRTSEAVVYCVLTVLVYLVAVFSHPAIQRTSNSELIQGIFFLVTTAAVCISVCHVSRKNRWVAFKLQSELRNERIQLEISMDKLRETESQLFQSEKIRAVAGLASGLLHEINNPVNFSLMAVRVLKKKLVGMPPELETLGDIEDGVGRIGSIVSDLRSFAYPEHGESMRPFSLRSAVEKSIRFSVNEIESGRVQIVNNHAMDSSVVGAEGQIVQVFLNLIVNASRAIRKNVGSKKADSRQYVEIEATYVGDRVSVVVRDYGIGMSPEQLNNALTQNSLRRTSEGLGLGISICDKIVKAHGGQLVITSQLGEGTQVTFDLPIHQENSGEKSIENKHQTQSVNQISNLDHEGVAQ